MAANGCGGLTHIELNRPAEVRLPEEEKLEQARQVFSEDGNPLMRSPKFFR